MRVTAIEYQKRTPSRMSFFIDGEFVCGVNAGSIARLGLHTGMEISREMVDSLLFSDAAETAQQRVLKLIARRFRSTSEIIRYLEKNRFDNRVTESVVARLTELNLLDDREFSRMFCRDALRRSPVGLALLRRKLAQKGISRGIISDVTDEYFPKDEEASHAAAAAEAYAKRLGRSSKTLEKEKFRKRIYDFLLRKGFSFDAVREALKQITEDKS